MKAYVSAFLLSELYFCFLFVSPISKPTLESESISIEIQTLNRFLSPVGAEAVICVLESEVCAVLFGVERFALSDSPVEVVISSGCSGKLSSGSGREGVCELSNVMIRLLAERRLSRNVFPSPNAIT